MSDPKPLHVAREWLELARWFESETRAGRAVDLEIRSYPRGSCDPSVHVRAQSYGDGGARGSETLHTSQAAMRAVLDKLSAAKEPA